MRYDYNIQVGMEKVGFGFDADDKQSKPSAPSGYGSATALKTLTVMCHECSSVEEFEMMIDSHGGCQMIKDEPATASSTSGGMSWGSSMDEEE